MNVYEFDAIIKKAGEIDGAVIEFPYDVVVEFGTRGQVKVKARFDDHEYRGSLVKMGTSMHCIGITKSIRQIINKQPGDKVHVIIEKDTEPRVVEVPEDLQEKFIINDEAESFFNSLSFSNRRRYVNWLISAKKTETREKRLEETISLLLEKQKQP